MERLLQNTRMLFPQEAVMALLKYFNCPSL
jgi:hypothetical protein